jgi:CheY-like chemotaxis protein
LGQVEATQPDLVLPDWELPGLRTHAHLSTLRTLCPRLKVIGLSGRPEARQAALTARADAFVSKGDPPERLLAAVDDCWRKRHRDDRRR